MKHGSLFSGYDGLGLAVEPLGARTVWVSDIDPGACKILAHRLPNTPNLGDITAVDWSQVEPVDVLTGGFPCQDVSHAGRRAGLIRGETRSGLWASMLTAIDHLRPPLVVAENVRGLLSAPADSDLEPCSWCVGDEPAGVLRALGAVLGDLADIGYDAQWCGLRASDLGLCHHRFRVFIVAYPTGNPRRFSNRNVGPAADARSKHCEQWRLAATGETPSGWSLGELAGHGRALPTPTTRDHKGANQRGDDSCLTGALLPTPAASQFNDGESVESWSARRDRVKLTAANGNGMGTPSVADGMGGHLSRSGDRSAELLLPGVARELGTTWGPYADAVGRHAATVGRSAPAPTELGAKGGQRLSPRFVEWMMALPAGWVTDVPDLTRVQQLKALGNGVIPLQAEAALRHMLTTEAAA